MHDSLRKSPTVTCIISFCRGEFPDLYPGREHRIGQHAFPMRCVLRNRNGALWACPFSRLWKKTLPAPMRANVMKSPTRPRVTRGSSPCSPGKPISRIQGPAEVFSVQDRHPSTARESFRNQFKILVFDPNILGLKSVNGERFSLPDPTVGVVA